jgi:hypothetical protein
MALTAATWQHWFMYLRAEISETTKATAKNSARLAKPAAELLSDNSQDLCLIFFYFYATGTLVNGNKVSLLQKKQNKEKTVRPNFLVDITETFAKSSQQRSIYLFVL